MERETRLELATSTLARWRFLFLKNSKNRNTSYFVDISVINFPFLAPKIFSSTIVQQANNHLI